MSKRRMMIELEPSLVLKTEVFAGTPCMCPMCRGTGVGTVRVKEDGSFELNDGPCDGCAGSGEVMAVVTVEWKPVKER